MSVARVRQKLDLAKAGQNPALPSKGTLLDAIRLDLINLTRTAAAIDQVEPGFADKFPSPDNAGERALVTAADKILQQLSAQPGDSAAIQAPRRRSWRNSWRMK